MAESKTEAPVSSAPKREIVRIYYQAPSTENVSYFEAVFVFFRILIAPKRDELERKP